MTEMLSGAWRLYGRSAALVMGVMYVVGTLGHLRPETLPVALALTPWFLLLIGSMVLAPSFAAEGPRFAAWALFTFVFTLLVEAAGVKTGIIFGEYRYGPVLGWKWLEVPLIIGFNWVVTVNAGVCLASRLLPAGGGTGRRMLILLLTGLIAMAFDILLEPVAIRLDYWQWANVTVPLRNYVAWLVTAALAAVLHPRLASGTQDLGSHGRLAVALLGTQAVFFLVMRLAWRLQGG